MSIFSSCVLFEIVEPYYDLHRKGNGKIEVKEIEGAVKKNESNVSN